MLFQNKIEKSHNNIDGTPEGEDLKPRQLNAELTQVKINK